MAILHNYIRFGIAAWLGVLGLAASEHHGQVKFGGLPVPGATVTAIQGEKKLTAISGEQGSYSFANLPDGVWTIQVEMLCFAPIKQEVTVAPDAPASEWDLKLLPFEEIKAAAGTGDVSGAGAGFHGAAGCQHPKSKIQNPRVQCQKPDFSAPI